MSQTFAYVSPGQWSEDLGTSAIRLGEIPGLVTMADLGAVGMSNIVIDNPAGTVGHSSDQIVGWKQLQVTESAAPVGNQRTYTGYITDRTYRRGTGPRSSIRTGAGNEIEVNLSDLNELLTFKVITGTDSVRPSETVTARTTWLLGSTYLSGLVYDNGFVTASSVVMDATDYIGQQPAAVLADMALATRFNYFVYYDEAAGQASLWFQNSNTSAAWDSGIKISNDLVDIDQAAIVAGTATTFWPTYDAELHRDPSRCYSGVYLVYKGGNVYVTSSSIESNFVGRDGSAPNSNVKTSAAATVVANNFLADNATEDDRITVTIQVAAAQANCILAGQLVQFKATHLPGYDSYVQMRVMQRTLSQSIETDEWYQMQLILSPTTILPTLLQFTTDSILGDYDTATWPSGAPGAGVLGYSVLALRGATAPTAYAKSATSALVGGTYVTGTEYTNLGASAVDSNGFTHSYRYPTTSSDTAYLRWSPTGSLGGSSRPRQMSVLIGGVTTIGTPVEDFIGGGTMSSTPASSTVHANGPGIIIFSMSYDYPGPGDHVGWAGFTVTSANSTMLGYDYAAGSFQPLTWMSYLIVDSAGDYSVSYNLTPPTGFGDPLSSYNCARLGCWFG